MGINAGGKLGSRLTAPLVNKRQIWTCPRGMRVEIKTASLSGARLTVTWREEIPRVLDLSTCRTPVVETRYLRCENRICFAAT